MVPVASLQDKELLQGFDQATLEKLARHCAIVEFKDGARILSAVSGERQDRLLFLVRGKVVVAKKFVENVAAKDVSFQHIDSQVYGEISWLLGTPPSAELISSGASRFVAVDGPQLRALCQEDVAFGREFYKRLAELLARRTMNLTDLSKITTAEQPAVFEF
ncbi:MAG: cyclic nucleotide-binding domain-containing protein [Magnetococcales bacterium]|nr:cyclic nucleotide-binding domain-containing protein [Magnetococcales bacterium]